MCPEGWRIPTKYDVDALFDFLGDNAGGKLKAVGTLENGLGYWFSPNVGATNETGFTVLPAGYMVGDSFYSYGRYAVFWICTANPDFDENQENSNAMDLHRLSLWHRSDDANCNQGFDNWTWNAYYSVRCIKK